MTKTRKGQPPPGTARVIAIANQKGGVGKSTTAVSLGACLAEEGHSVLVLDLDPQGNASTGMGIRHESRDITIYEVLAIEAPIEKAIVKTPVANLDAVPSTIDLAGAEIELVSLFSRESRLARALEPVRDGRYEFILLDCPPSLGLLTVNALVAAEELIVPIQCEYYALEGLGQLLRNVGLVQQNVNPALRLTGIVMTMFDPRTKLSEQVVEEVKKHFRKHVYDTIIPRTVRLSEAPGYGEPITVYDPKSRGAECYRALAAELLDRPIPDSVERISVENLPQVISGPPPKGEPRARSPKRRAKAETPEGVPEETKRDVPVDNPPAEEEDVEPVEVQSGSEPARMEEEVFADAVTAPDTVEELDGREFAKEFSPDGGDGSGVEDLREIEGIGPPPEKADENEEAGRKKKWRMFRKGGDA